MRKLLFVATLVAMVLLMPAASTQARGVKLFESKVKITRLGGEPTKAPKRAASVAGRVKSEKARCLEGRYVELFRKQTGPDAGMGNDDTNENGHWSLPIASLPADRYYATVTELEIGAGICGADKSRVYDYAP